MINPNAIAFDIDSVIADTMSLFLDIAKKEHNIKNIRYEDITNYNLSECLNIEEEIINNIVEKIIDGNYSVTLKPINGASEVLTKLLTISKNLLFVTARPRIGTLSQWVFSELLPNASNDSVEIIATGSFEAKKEILLSKSRKWFVEDRVLTCFDLYEAGITPIVYNQPWNAEPHPFLKIESWNQLEKMILFGKD